MVFRVGSEIMQVYGLHFPQQAHNPSRDPTHNVFNNTLGFEKVFVISLPARTDRRDAFVLAAGLTGFEVEFIDGVQGSAVQEKFIPPSLSHENFKDGEIGCWRAHANVLQQVVQRNLSSVLILEDDADWDIRLKPLLYNFAVSSQALTQPLYETLAPHANAALPFSEKKSQKLVSDMALRNLPPTVTPKISPYGDNWDMLWLGHCGMRFPFVSSDFLRIPQGRVIDSPDSTVPEKDYLKAYTTIEDLKSNYPPHTRVVHHTLQGSCSQAYAISQVGARRLLYLMSLGDVNAQYDLMMSKFCEGNAETKSHTCLTVQPPIFSQHRAKGRVSATSDIAQNSDEIRAKGTTENIRWSTMLNLGILLEGGVDFEDQYPDTV